LKPLHQAALSNTRLQRRANRPEMALLTFNLLLERPLELDEGVHGHFVEQHAPHDGADHGAHQGDGNGQKQRKDALLAWKPL
ncbi:hypothetical protein P0G11_13400, partial [Adlercreutzia rubneri]|uniref:hypothetical protein n=1 Tax=Adlercreutzia rubneri TaxID=2916441 RepID=UPI0023B15E25